MKISIISDIHDNIEKLSLALPLCAKADLTLCCGDLCSPFVIRKLGTGLTHPVHIVFGNNDGDRFRLASNAGKFPHLQLHGEYAELSLDERLIAINHYDNIARGLAKGSGFDVVCFGHNHTYEVTTIGKTLLINPGEIYGGLSGHSTFAIYDTKTNEVQRIEL